ncbi:GPI mannosyltransferase 2 [Contarinia nasturtii]|uniref:GPI mannosyltransferase 2 n=1 Tax=Contarinia nasturtii TaxID=265458 RepID=UPI0012D4B0A5|nr:GPI mannosyltransferase 2 [Contarinia nasturtii]
MGDTKIVIQFAIISRILIVLLQLVSNYLIPDHDANVFISPKSPTLNGSACHSLVEKCFSGFRRWDGEYFLHVAEHGYTYENMLVFYPLFPFCVRYITNLGQTIIGTNCEFRDLALIIAIALNTVFFTKAALVLYQLTMEIFNDRSMARIVTTLFCFNPASIFFTAPYSESLFCWLSFSVMLYCARGRIGAAVLPLATGICCRSNGLLNFGFILYYVTRDIWTNGKTNWMHFFKSFLKVLLCAIVAGAAFGVVQAYFYSLYCENDTFEMSEAVKNYGIVKKYLLAGERKADWCSYPLPFSYSYLQSHYWNVGFMKYYEFKQIPNFVLASPILIMIIYHSIQFIMANPTIALRLGLLQPKSNVQIVKFNLFVYTVHAFALSIFCLFFVHIQVSTRMLASSTPYIYWLCAQYFQREMQRNSWKAFLQPRSRITKFIKGWFLGYFVIGTVLFCNFLPWT